MSIDCLQLKKVIVEPALIALGKHSASAVNLLLGTAAQESHMGKYLMQIKMPENGGIGIYQMERKTYDSLWEDYLYYHPAMVDGLRRLCGFDKFPPADRMASDLFLATGMARIFYLRFKEPLPAPDDIPGLALYWKQYYNTLQGKGTTRDFVDNYEVYVE